MTTSTETTTPVAGNWNEQKTKLKAQFTTLTDADLQYAEGKKEEMLTKVQAKIGKTKEEFETLLATI